MPIQSKARWARLKVGLMAILALAILAVLIFLLTGNSKPFSSKITIYTFFEDSAALVENSPVRLNGIVVGKVRKIALSGSKNLKQAVRMDLQIENKFQNSIPVDSTAKIGAENLLGTKFVNIKTGNLPQYVQDGSTIRAEDTADINDFMEQGNSLLIQLKSILQRVDSLVGVVEQGRGSIGKLLVDEELYNRIIGTVSEVQKLAAALNTTKGTMGKLVYDDALYNDIRGSIARLDNVIEGLQQGQGTAGKLLKDPAMFDNTNKAILDIRRMLAGIEAGQGTIGKLMKSDQLHNQVSATIGRVDIMIDKINSGQGTIGQLMVNSSLYDSLNGTTRELHEFVKDFRKDPRKFLRIKLSLF